MHRFRFAALAAVAVIGFTSMASAADLPVKAPVAPVVAAPSWTGWHLGLNAGGNWGTSQTSTTVSNSTAGLFLFPAAVAAINAIGRANLNTNGFTGGVQGGYNYQMGQWLIGIEADFNYLRSAGSSIASGPGVGLGVTVNVTSSVSTDWLFTARPRVGIISNNWLFYATGGLAVTRIKAAWSEFNAGAAIPITETASASSTKAGWVIGGGIETMLPGQWIIGAEYLYVDFGSVSTTSFASAQGLGPISNPFNHTADLSLNVVRARLSKLF